MIDKLLFLNDPVRAHTIEFSPNSLQITRHMMKKPEEIIYGDHFSWATQKKRRNFLTFLTQPVPLPLLIFSVQLNIL